MSSLPANVLPGNSPEDLRAKQLKRERAARDQSLGRRAKSIARGDLGPVLKRWVSGAVLPVHVRLRSGLQGDGLSEALNSPLFGMPTHASKSRSLQCITEWFLKSDDNGRDLTLAVLGTAISRLATSGKPLPLTAILGACAEAARETAIGQFITQVQGAKAMMRVRKSGKEPWKQGKQLGSVAAMLGGQAREALRSAEEMAGEEFVIGAKKVVKVTAYKSDGLQQITLRVPGENDWRLLELATGGEEGRTPWISFAMLVLCAAQAEAGWFDLTEIDPKDSRAGAAVRRGQRRKAKGLVLSTPAYSAIKKDLDKWLGLGFVYEPMLVEPVDGDYLSVKHREVAGGRGPMGVRTQAKDSAAWHVVSETLAKTKWKVAEDTLRAIRESEFVQSLVAKDQPDEVKREAILGAYRKDAMAGALYMPVFMDFRGRAYLRPNLVTYQGTDLQKALLTFTPHSRYTRSDQVSSSQIRAVVYHMSNLYGNGLDKAPWGDRWEWYQGLGIHKADAMGGDWESPPFQDLLAKADEPLQLLTALILHKPGRLDMMACQIDGTCNGLQHLSALFRDETAAPFVNLTRSTVDVPPCDIYGEIAGRVSRKLRLLAGGAVGSGLVGGGHGAGDAVGRRELRELSEVERHAAGNPAQSQEWAQRILATVKIDRKLCKKPVMVLPYGGTRGTIEEAVLESILGQAPDDWHWRYGRAVVEGRSENTNYRDWREGNYAAHSHKELKDHPLLHSDAKKLAGVIWDTIGEMLPKAMSAMQTFRNIAKSIGDRTLEWDTGFAIDGYEYAWDSLWVTQAKPVSARSTVKFQGYHLPQTVRGLSIRQGRDEIDPAAHTTGIVANFIHSMDAAHLAHSLHAGPRTDVGTIHDCFITRPSLMRHMGAAVRTAFAMRYGRMDPLALPVHVLDPQGRSKRGGTQSYASWYDLAKACGTEFPEDGAWEPAEVLDSPWFFS